MTTRKVLTPKQLPVRMPLVHTLFAWFLLDKFDLSGSMWAGVVWTFIGFLWFAWAYVFVGYEEYVELSALKSEK